MHAIDLVSSWEIQYLAERFEKATGSRELFSALNWTKVEPAVVQENGTADLRSSHTQDFDEPIGRAFKPKCNPLQLNDVVSKKMAAPQSIYDICIYHIYI